MRKISLVFGASALFACSPASALMLGDIEQLSALGQPYRARISFTRGLEEPLESRCINVIGKRPEGASEVTVLSSVRARVESPGDRSSIVLESNESVSEPILQLSVEVRCDPLGRVIKDYVLLLEPYARPALGGQLSLAPPPPPTAVAPLPPPAAPARPRQAAPGATREGTPASPPAARRKARASAVPDTGGAAGPQAAKRPRQRAAVRDILRLAPALESPASLTSPQGRGWGLRYTHELGKREGPPVTEAERARLRMEYAERMGDGANIRQLQALQTQNQALTERAATLGAERSASEARSAREAGKARVAWLMLVLLAAISLAIGLWLWRKRARNVPFGIATQDLFDTAPRRPAPEPVVVPTPPPVEPPALRPSQHAVYAPAVYAPAAAEAALALSADDFVKTVRLARPVLPEAPPPTPVLSIDFDLPLDRTPTKPLDLSLDYEPERNTPAVTEPAALFEAASIQKPAPAADRTAAVAAEERARAYREAYVAERYPEIAAGSIDLGNPGSVVDGARLMYQDDQDLPRAVGLLRLAWSVHPEFLALWLCLLEIYWLEDMRDAYVDLALRFHAKFSSAHPQWPMVAKLGRELDPDISTFSAEGLRAVPEGRANWLNAELDMTSSVLALEMRAQVLVPQ